MENRDALFIYTDGSAKGNGSVDSCGGYGVAVVKESEIDNPSAYYCARELIDSTTTNNKEELKGLIVGLHHAFWAIKTGETSPIIVYSDSAYCVHGYTTWMHNWEKKGWSRGKNQEVKNLEYFKVLYKLYHTIVDNNYDIRVEKVSGHSGVLGNEIADAIATDNLKKIDELGVEFEELMHVIQDSVFVVEKK